jgi:hypothetical protein
MQMRFSRGSTGAVEYVADDQAERVDAGRGSRVVSAQLVAVVLDDTATLEPTMTTFDCRPWAGTLTPSARLIPQANGQERPDLQAPSTTTIPTTPITLLSEAGSPGGPVVCFVWIVFSR